MPPAPPMSNKDGMQVLKLSFDESQGAIRVLADITSVITDLNIRASNGDNIAIADQTGTNKMAVNADGSINVDAVIGGEVAIEVSAADGDNIAISDGVDTMAVNADGSINVLGPLTNTQLRASAVPVSATSLPLPTGAATSANQATEIASLSSIDSKLTSPLTVTGPLTDTQLRASPVPVSLTSTTITGTVAATQSGIWTVQPGNTANTVAWKVDGSAVTQPISAASLPLPTGASTSALQTTGNTSLASIDSKLTAPLSVTGPLTDTQLRASAVPVSAASLPLPTGAATSALQTTGNSSLSSIDGKLNSLGQKTSSASVPVVIASDQSAIPAKAATPTAGIITQAAITVGTTAVRATVTGSAPSASRSVLIVNPDSTSTAKFYMGTSTVTSTGANRGLQLLGGDKVAFNSDAGDYYIISDTAAQTVYIVEQA